MIDLLIQVAGETTPPFDWTPILAILGLIFGGSSAVGLIIVAIINRKVKSPADRQAEVEFGVGLLRDQIAKAERDSERWLDMEQFLREELRKTEADKDRISGLLETAHAQLTELRREKNELEQRLNGLAMKASRGDHITLADITGQDPINEDTEF